MKVQPTTQQLIAMLYERLSELLDRPQRQSRSDVKPLTDEEIWKNDAIMSSNSGYGASFDTLRDIVRAIEAAHGIKGDA